MLTASHTNISIIDRFCIAGRNLIRDHSWPLYGSRLPGSNPALDWSAELSEALWGSEQMVTFDPPAQQMRAGPVRTVRRFRLSLLLREDDVFVVWNVFERTRCLSRFSISISISLSVSVSVGRKEPI